ncbi:MAG: prephenate dehydrogenase/arogenate dehydrogenase family protein [Bacteroidetes bacterium]|jgi:prephenate dehydrogenase|nr:prephenate dehydrogenase/arogenate dehydrogenase family protein [Bacteroidota bacterium]
MIRRIAILGVGLIGGSLALAWKKVRDDLTLVGYDAPDVLDRAAERGALDEKAATPEAAVEGADLVVLATPLAPMLRLVDLIAPHLAPGTLVTDVGSVKTPVVEHAREVLPASAPFIGGHPMAGAERSGVDHADALLFENATYVLCPPPDADDALSAYPGFVDLIEGTGAHVLLLDAPQHDEIAAAVSHLPQLLAVLLMNHAAALNDADDAVLRLAAGGFRDMTRIASSPFSMWRDVLIANQGPILDALGSFAAHLRKARNRLIEENVEALGQQFSEARHVRNTIPRDTKGFLHPLADIYVFAEDRPGELLAIIQTLYDAGLNIKDIELLKIREGTGGAFRMSFTDDEEANTAVEALTNGEFIAYRL